MKFALGLAIAANAEKRDLDVLLEVVSDAKLGSGRDEVARRISAWNDPRIVLVLVGFLKTGDSVWAAITALKRARAWSYADAVRPYLTSTNDASREAAEQFMKARQRALGTST
ncbi:MAG TPA: hypothetical protein VMD91_10485 [Candidatus Sulfotelmatobacter sp.]|nr:hypothetical protein [Candidatus Sulfotelmatobacter sp.]